MKILLFGRLAASLGREVELDFRGCRTIADVRRALARLHPRSAGDLAVARARACVNDEMSSEDRAIGPADEIAFLPPLSGG
jgi:molybdopterin converting factor small subunit